MSKEIHTYANGLKCLKESINPAALKRYGKINLHEPYEEEIFLKILPEVKTYVNLGAAWGYYSLLAKKIDPSIDVYAFEPKKYRVEYIGENSALNDISGIKVFNYKVGDKDTDDCKTLNSFVEEILKKDIDLLSMDIQGAGTLALIGANRIMYRVRHVLIGTHGVEHDRCTKLLTDYGFDIKLSKRAHEIAHQPDGLLWAYKDETRHRTNQ